jgi:hypothetical protein
LSAAIESDGSLLDITRDCLGSGSHCCCSGLQRVS